MNRAAKALTARDPLISAHAVRFLLMAGTSASTFLAGFRQRQDGKLLYMWQSASGSLVARQARIHNGAGSFFSDAARGRLKLSYRTHGYSYNENTIVLGPNGYMIVTELSIAGQSLPETLLTALPGRLLRDVVGYHKIPAFFTSKYTTIIEAETSNFPSSGSLDLFLAMKWHPLSRVLPHLR